MFGTAAGIAGAAATVGNWVYQGGKWVWQEVKGNNEAKARKNAQIMANSRRLVREHQEQFRALVRTAQNKQILSTQAIPQASMQVGISKDQGSIFGSEIKQSHLIIGAIALLLLVKK